MRQWIGIWGAAALMATAPMVCRAAGPRVAVFSEAGFPHYGSPDLLSPQGVARDLGQAGIAADVLNEAALCEPLRMNTGRYAAVVLVYGNTYPRAAFLNLRAFHRAGGCLITTGVPFTHPVSRAANGTWNDTGHDSGTALFGPQGIGVGGFLDTARDPAVSIAPKNAFHLNPAHPVANGHVQVLDVASLPPGDIVTPGLVEDGMPITALIEHHGDDFNGAVDAWTIFPRADDLFQDLFNARQLISRATVAALAAKGALDEGARAKAFAALDAIPRPKLYANIVLPTPPRPYPTLQPKMRPPARHLYVADVRRLPRDEQLLLFSLQGLVNRKQPRLYLISTETDPFWLATMQKQGHIGAPIVVANPLSLLQTFRDAYHGAVVADPKIFVSPEVAVNVAAADDLLLATPALAARVGVPVRVDLRGKFHDDADAMRYVRTTLLPKLNPFLGAFLAPRILGSQLDDLIAAKGVCFWVTGAMEQGQPGADGVAEGEELEALFAQMPLGAVIRGYPWSGDGFGLGEGPGVTFCSRFGKMLTASDYVSNFSVMSGIVLPQIKQKPQPPAPTLDRSKVYLAFTLSDGDNLSIWKGFYHDSFADPLHGTIPLGYGMGPTLIDVAPPIVQWAYEHMAPTDEFLCDVSGAGYIYPPHWGEALRDRDAAYRTFFTNWTQTYMRRTDMRGLRVMNLDAAEIAHVGAMTPNVPFQLPDYGYAGGKTYADLTFTVPTGQAVFRSVSYGPKSHDLADQIRAHVGAGRPAFLNAFVVFWGYSQEKLKDTLALLGPEYVAVTPSQLNTLYRQTQGRAAVKTAARPTASRRR